MLRAHLFIPSMFYYFWFEAKKQKLNAENVGENCSILWKKRFKTNLQNFVNAFSSPPHHPQIKIRENKWFKKSSEEETEKRGVGGNGSSVGEKWAGK